MIFPTHCFPSFYTRSSRGLRPPLISPLPQVFPAERVTSGGISDGDRVPSPFLSPPIWLSQIPSLPLHLPPIKPCTPGLVASLFSFYPLRPPSFARHEDTIRLSSAEDSPFRHRENFLLGRTEEAKHNILPNLACHLLIYLFLFAFCPILGTLLDYFVNYCHRNPGILGRSPCRC